MYTPVLRRLVALGGGQAMRAFSSSAAVSEAIKRITVVGGGQMGAGIAQVAATFDHQVTLVDVSPEALERGRQYMGKSLGRVAKKKFPEDPAQQTNWVDSILGRIQGSTELSKGVSQADLVVEAIVENINVKQRLFADVAQTAPADCILASNTSSLPIGRIFENVSAERRALAVGLHFFNPVAQMKLVEVVRTGENSEETVQKALDFVRAIGKSPAVCQDTPGFIVNRLLLPYMMEAIRLLERGVADSRDIDTAMKLGAGYPMGPFELADYVGLDTVKAIVDGWYTDGEGLKGDSLFMPSPKLNELVAAGHLGVKSGQGFYNYKK
ncbi:hydroxyacyl-coenzyme A dehydrogenase [Kickxella alabastrina]|uniref:hydroxyacyl-coenzyme A dehydrogenase n=1 Tax=Kickxella alabastrina TaxID=61397 RepID=UPI00221E6589|nr:hydroxyacyl-coenzyme A dehydrogenase [Kickxella alabastrina]KAI7833627.1 hydroxyacyl-coenzyme A dehydrogenase [Kickxella alabastrina]KAJ1940079.1 hypothetical protein GGF37_004130 [Kickxella alabastrina]